MRKKSCFNGIAKCIFLSFIVGHAFNTKPKLVNNYCLHVHNAKENTPIPNDDKENIPISNDDNKELDILDLIQSRYILAIFIPELIIPLIIVFYVGSFSISEIINAIYIALKSLSLMITVFLPVALIDSIIYSRKYKKGNPNIIFLKMQIVFQMFGFYSLVMLGNIRVWLIKIYITMQYKTVFIMKIHLIEIISLVLFVTFLLASTYCMIRQSFKNKKEKYNHNFNVTN